MKMKSPSQEWRILNSYKMALEHCQKKIFSIQFSSFEEILVKRHRA